MQAKKLNREAVQEEDRVAKLPANHESRQMRAQYKLDEIERKRKVKEDGDDFDLVKLREIPADKAESKFMKKKNKTDPDQGFTSWQDCTARSYRRWIKDHVPDWHAYRSEKDRLGDDFY